MQAAFKQRWKVCLALLIVALALLLVSAVFSETGYFRARFTFNTVLRILMNLVGGVVVLGSVALSLRFAYQGRRYASVVFSSVFGIVMLALAVSSFWQVLPYVSFRNSEGIKGLISLVGSVCIALIAVNFYVFSHIAPRYNGSACGAVGLALAIVYTLCSLGVFVWSLIDYLKVDSFGEIVLQEAAGLLSILALALAFFAVVAGMLPAGRARRKPVKAENPMFPALENYREKLRKERA